MRSCSVQPAAEQVSPNIGGRHTSGSDAGSRDQNDVYHCCPAAYKFRMMDNEGKLSIFDPVRKKYVALTQEEWVRQHVIQFLVQEKQVPLSLISAEAEIRLYNTRKRFDLAVFDRNGNALLVVECKAPSVPVTQNVLDQAVRYNMTMKVGFLMLTNGLDWSKPDCTRADFH